MICLRCERPVPASSLWSVEIFRQPKPLCPGNDLDACLTEASALVDPPDPPYWITTDDLPPDDIGVCCQCQGAGSIFTSTQTDWETGYRPTDECPHCHGTGEEPVILC